MAEPMKDTTTATIRTTVNGTVLTAVVALVVKLTGWEIDADQLLPFTPIIVPIIAVFYRLSLWLTDRFPAVGYILFGKPTKPRY